MFFVGFHLKAPPKFFMIPDSPERFSYAFKRLVDGQRPKGLSWKPERQVQEKFRECGERQEKKDVKVKEEVNRSAQRSGRKKKEKN